MSSKINPNDFLFDVEDEREFRIARLSARNKKKLLARPVADEEETALLDDERDVQSEAPHEP